MKKEIEEITKKIISLSANPFLTRQEITNLIEAFFGTEDLTEIFNLLERIKVLQRKFNQQTINSLSEIETTYSHKASFHGESWYQCDHCNNGFEIYSKYNYCAKCGRKFKDK